jgi:hypothetical protein
LKTRHQCKCALVPGGIALKNVFSHLKTIKVALLGDTANQFLTQSVRGAGYNEGFDLQIFEADFNQIKRQVFARAIPSFWQLVTGYTPHNQVLKAIELYGTKLAPVVRKELGGK